MARRLAAGGAALVALTSAAAAVEIRVTRSSDGQTATIELTGGYVQGDGLKLRGEIGQLPQGMKLVAHLNGGGGMHAEAMSIGRLFHSMGIRTVVPPKARCSSPCHLILVGGRSTDPTQPSYVKHSSGSIGFGAFNDTASEKAYTIRDLYAAVENTQQSILKVADYLTEVGADLELLRHTFDDVAPGSSRTLRDEDALAVGIGVFDDSTNRLIDSKPFRRRIN